MQTISMKPSGTQIPAIIPSSGERFRKIVFITHLEGACAACGLYLSSGDFVWFHEGRGYCLNCSDLGNLAFLPSGDHAISRRAARYSQRVATVLRHSKARKRNERQGILADPAAIRRAKEESRADAALRAARMAHQAQVRAAQDLEYVEAFRAAILKEYPGCPVAEANEIAAHACEKYSGRVGRSAAAKQLDSSAVTLAVRAHVRHVHTPYDELLANNCDREVARERVAEQLNRVAEVWRATTCH